MSQNRQTDCRHETYKRWITHPSTGLTDKQKHRLRYTRTERERRDNYRDRQTEIYTHRERETRQLQGQTVRQTEVTDFVESHVLELFYKFIKLWFTHRACTSVTWTTHRHTRLTTDHTHCQQPVIPVISYFCQSASFQLCLCCTL